MELATIDMDGSAMLGEGEIVSVAVEGILTEFPMLMGELAHLFPISKALLLAAA